MACLGVDYFGLSCLEYANLLESAGLHLLYSLGKSLAIIYHLFNYFSSHALFLLFFWDSNCTNVSSSLQSHGPLKLC